MKDQSCTDEITQIFQEAAPARQALLDNYNNLMNLAEYCENNYLQVRWKFSADIHLGHGLSYTVASMILGLADARRTLPTSMHSANCPFGELFLVPGRTLFCSR